MKLWKIFTLYLILLSAFPCACKADCGNDTKVEIVSDKEHPDHDHHNENCSPFCICSCCGGSVIEFEITEFSFKKFTSFYGQNNYNAYHWDYISLDHSQIWQPPK